MKTPRQRKSLDYRYLRPFILLIAIVTASTAYAQQPFRTTVPGDILDQFQAAKQMWTTNVWVYANNLFALLALIEFAWSAAVMLLDKTDLQSWTAALVRKIMWLGAFYMLLLKGNQWIPWIIASFTQIGSNAAGFGGNPLSPGDVFAQGLAIAGGLMDAASTSAFFTNPGSSLALAFGALMILLSYTVITIHYVVTVVESYIILSVGFIFLGFGGSRWTAPYVERYIGLAVSVGVKMMLLYMLISAGMGLGVGWMTEAQGVGTSAHPALTAFDVIGAAVIFMMLCWQIPKLFSAVLGGAPALTGGDLISTTTGLVAGAAAVGSLAAGGVALAARGAAAISGVGAAAGSGGGGAGSSAAGVGSATRGGATGGGTVPPPSPPPLSPSGNGGSRQPGPPLRNGGSGGASPDVAGVGSHSSSESRNGSSRYQRANGTGSSSVASELSLVGGDDLAGSGFEAERPTGGFAPAYAPIVTTPPARRGFANSHVTSIDSTAAVPPPDRGASSDESDGAIPFSPSGSGQNTSPTPGVVSDVRSVASGTTSAEAQQPPTASRRERIGSAVRKTDQVLSRAAGRFRGLRNQLGGLPSDAAPHTSPPRMPIDHHD